MVASEHTEVIQWRRWFIVVDVIDSQGADQDGFMYDGGADLDEDYQSGSGEAGMSTGVTEVV